MNARVMESIFDAVETIKSLYNFPRRLDKKTLKSYRTDYASTRIVNFNQVINN